MASNFKIIYHRNSDNLHLKLFGDFDGSSAHELANILKAHQNEFWKIFIHTCSLSSLHPFGLDVFKKNCSNNGLSCNLAFTGEYGEKMAQHDSKFL